MGELEREGSEGDKEREGEGEKERGGEREREGERERTTLLTPVSFLSP